MNRYLFAASAALFFVGCQTARPLYYWGNYENVAYLSYSKPEKATLEYQAQELEEDVQKAAGSGLKTHPGLHAQLGYVYLQLGRADDALKQFEEEKTIFPESAPFMNRMIQKIKSAAAS